MNITQMINASNASSLARAQTSAQATTAVSSMAQTLKKADARIQSQLDSTSAQLSSFGKLKSSVSDAQLAAKALSGFTSTSTAADIKSAATRFVASFNTALTIATSTAAAPGGSSAESGSARRVSSDLSRTVSSNFTTMDALKKIGFKQQTDGSLTLDSAKFEAAQKADPAAVQASLSKVGQLVDKTAAKELATGGSVSGSMAALNQRSSTLKAQQNAMLAMQQQFSAAQSNSQNTSNAGYGLAAYRYNY